MAGKFIVFEGIDGSGKTTQLKLLSEYLKKKNLDCVLTKNPTNGKIGAILREHYLKNKTSPLADALLFAADRAEQAEAVIRPSLEQGKVVISDRYYYSNWVYQSVEGIDLDWLVGINKFFPKPDLVFLIDVSPETAIERIKSERAGRMEKFEKTRTLELLREKYLEIAKKERIAIVNGDRKIGEVQKDIVNGTEKIL